MACLPQCVRFDASHRSRDRVSLFLPRLLAEGLQDGHLVARVRIDRVLRQSGGTSSRVRVSSVSRTLGLLTTSIANSADRGHCALAVSASSPP